MGEPKNTLTKEQENAILEAFCATEDFETPAVKAPRAPDPEQYAEQYADASTINEVLNQIISNDKIHIG